ncbi:MAG: hypothetical protein ACK49X_09925, partial [Akkermansiaceae bacterium]
MKVVDVGVTPEAATFTVELPIAAPPSEAFVSPKVTAVPLLTALAVVLAAQLLLMALSQFELFAPVPLVLPVQVTPEAIAVGAPTVTVTAVAEL